MKLELTRHELATLLGGIFVGDESPENILELTSLERAQAQAISILFDLDLATYSKNILQNSQASLIIASQQLIPDKSFLLVPDPLNALNQLITYKKSLWKKDSEYDQRWPHAYISIHATVDDTVTIEPGVIIKSHSTVGAHSIIKAHSYIDHEVEIGNDCIIGPHVTLHDQTIIGNAVQIDAQTIIGTDGYGYRPSQHGFKKIPHAGNVSIGDHVEIGASVTIDRAVLDTTTIERGCKIDNHTYIAHNVTIKEHTLILAHVVIGGSTQIGSWCRVGAQTAIKDHITIGNHVDIVGKSGIMANVTDRSTIAGFPATSFLQWKKQMVCVSKLPDLMRKQNRRQTS